MTAKVFIENKLVKTLYLQRYKIPDSVIVKRIDELYRDVERIGLEFRIEIVDKCRKIR